MDNKREEQEQELHEQVVRINRLAKVVTGGRRFSFGAIVIVGDKQGNVGAGFGKARQVPDAIKKAKEKAKRNMFKVNIIKGTIPHEIVGRHGAVKVLIKPATPGTGVIASGVVRAICDLVGAENILTKIISRSSNAYNVAYATLDAFSKLKTIGDYARLRDISVDQLLGKSGSK